MRSPALASLVLPVASLVLPVASLALAGCPSRDVATPPDGPPGTVVIDVDPRLNRDLDLLFMVANSGDMGDDQAALAAAIPAFLAALATTQNGLPNLHLGVISSDVGAGGYYLTGCHGGGDRGQLQVTGTGCAASPGPEPFVIDILHQATQPRTRNYVGELGDVLGCMVQLGTTGCGFAQPLEAMYQALNDNPANGAFLREDAYLAVLLVTDADDCSAADPALFDPNQDAATLARLGPHDTFRCTEFGITCAEGDLGRQPGTYTGCHARTDSYLRDPRYYAEFLKSLKADENMIVVAALAGPPAPVEVALDTSGIPDLQPSCGAESAEPSLPGVRLDELVGYFRNHSYQSICAPDMAVPLQQIAELITGVIGVTGRTCIEENILAADQAPDAPGLQVDCQVEDVYLPGTDEERRTPRPGCTMQADGLTPVEDQPPCWYVFADPTHCASTPTQLVFATYPPGDGASPGTHLIATCRSG